MRFRSLLALIAVAILPAILPSTAQAQGYQIGLYTPGVDMPLFAVYEYRGRDVFDAGTVTATYSFVLMENTDNAAQPPSVDSMILSATGGSPAPTLWPTANPSGPVEYPQRPPRIYYKEVYVYNGIDWRNVLPTTTYTQFVDVSWGAGIGRYTGRPYPAGSTTLAMDYTVN